MCPEEKPFENEDEYWEGLNEWQEEHREDVEEEEEDLKPEALQFGFACRGKIFVQGYKG